MISQFHGVLPLNGGQGVGGMEIMCTQSRMVQHIYCIRYCITRLCGWCLHLTVLVGFNEKKIIVFQNDAYFLLEKYLLHIMLLLENPLHHKETT